MKQKKKWSGYYIVSKRTGEATKSYMTEKDEKLIPIYAAIGTSIIMGIFTYLEIKFHFLESFLVPGIKIIKKLIGI